MTWNKKKWRETKRNDEKQKEVTWSDSSWRFACGDVFQLVWAITTNCSTTRSIFGENCVFFFSTSTAQERILTSMDDMGQVFPKSIHWRLETIGKRCIIDHIWNDIRDPWALSPFLVGVDKNIWQSACCVRGVVYSSTGEGPVDKTFGKSPRLYECILYRGASIQCILIYRAACILAAGTLAPQAPTCHWVQSRPTPQGATLSSQSISEWPGFEF